MSSSVFKPTLLNASTESPTHPSPLFFLFQSTNGLQCQTPPHHLTLPQMSSSAVISSSAAALPPPPLTTTKTSFSQNLNKIGFGYAIAIAFGFLVLLSAVFLASYICCRYAAVRRRRRNESQQRGTGIANFNPNETSLYLPRIIFVSEDENEDASSNNVVVGLDQAVINSYPKFRFSRSSGNGMNEAVCSICLCEYKEAEMLRLMPDCRHYFHVMCIDAWLKLNASCPVCRNSPLPTPLSTPLSEVVPLSQYAGGRRRS